VTEAPGPADVPSYDFGALARAYVRHHLPRSGLLPRLVQFGPCLRAAVIADLYLAGRLVSTATEGDIESDTGPTGDAATDLVLDYIDRNPSSSLERLLRLGPSLRDEVVHSLVATQVWSVRIYRVRYRDAEPETIRFPKVKDAAAVVKGEATADTWSTVLALLLHPWSGADDQLYEACGAAGPFLRGYVSYRAFDNADNRSSMYSDVGFAGY
jgi:hypothetical protein